MSRVDADEADVHDAAPPSRWRMPPGGAWRLRMGELRELIDAAETEGDREALEDEYEVARLNAEMVDAEAEMALRLTAEAEAEMARLTADAESS